MNTIKLSAKVGAGARVTAWRDALDALGLDADRVITSGALRAEIVTGRVGALGKLWGTRWVAAFDAAPIDAVVYSYETPIAVRVAGRWYMPAERYSATTSGHQNKVAAATGAARVNCPDDFAALFATGPAGETARVFVADGMPVADAVRAAVALCADEAVAA